MPTPLRGTQTLVGQMGWVFERPSLTAIEVVWRWLFGVPLFLLCWIESQKIFAAVPPESAGLTALDPQNPWVAAVQLSSAWALYQPHLMVIFRWLLPVAGLAWVVVSGLGRSFILKRMDSTLSFRPVAMIALQAAWLAFFALTCWGWFSSIQWVASTHITPSVEPDLIGFAVWVIFLSLGFFTAWALLSWALSIAPLVMLLENRSALSALGQSLHMGRAMVLSAAPLPFGDQLDSEALHAVWATATVFYFVASDYFQVVRLKGFQEFCKMFRGSESAS